jgi:8-oxo-dGTP pyrophosphatase MutT (NUDIX family)
MRRLLSAKQRSASMLCADQPKVGVGVLLVDESGCLLLTLRRRPPEAGCWSIVGGKLDYLETLEQCAIREALEEVGAAISIDSLLCVTDHLVPRRRPALGLSRFPGARLDLRHKKLRTRQNARSPLVPHRRTSPQPNHYRPQCHPSVPTKITARSESPVAAGLVYPVRVSPSVLCCFGGRKSKTRRRCNKYRPGTSLTE